MTTPPCVGKKSRYIFIIIIIIKVELKEANNFALVKYHEVIKYVKCG